MQLKIFLIACALACAVNLSSAAIAEKNPKMSGLQLQQMQSHDIEAPQKIAFAAVMTVLQDDGYRIGSADRETGLITATASTKTKMTWMPFIGFGRSKKTTVVSAYIEDRGPNQSRIRLNFVMGKLSNNSSMLGLSDEEPILDAAVYQAAFEKIDQAVFVRLSLDTPAKAAEAPAPQAQQ